MWNSSKLNIKDWFNRHVLGKALEDVKYVQYSGQTFEKDVWLRVKVESLSYYRHPKGGKVFKDIFAKPTRYIPHVNLHDVRCFVAGIDEKGKIECRGIRDDINLFHFEVIEDKRLIKLLDCSIAKNDIKRREEEEGRQKEWEKEKVRMAKVYLDTIKKSKC